MREPGWLLRESQARVNAAIRSKDDLRNYQRDLLLPFLREHPRSAAYVDMGLGKSITVLTLIEELLSHDKIDKVLIIAPLRVAVQTWPTEIADWRHTAWMTHTLIRSQGRTAEVTSRERAEAARRPEQIHIINREQVVWLVEFWGKRWPYDCVIVDESTSFADHTSKRWKALAKVAQRTKRIHLLSGTPAPEGIADLFAQIYLLDGGQRFGRSITNFRQRYMMQNPWTKRWTPQLGAVDKVTELISDIVLTMREEDYLDIAKPVVIERPIVLEPKELQRYKEFERELILQLPDDVEIEAVNAGVLAQKLLQYASGVVYDTKRLLDENGDPVLDRKGNPKLLRTVHVIHDHKLEEMRQLIEENPGEPLLVAYWFESSLARLRAAFPQGVVMDRSGECVKDWNAGKLPLLFIHPQSAGHGLNMQLGPGHILIFFDTPASLELYLQVVKRIARSGQRRLVRVVHLVARGTLDALAVPKLRNKESAQDTIINRLRALRARNRK